MMQVLLPLTAKLQAFSKLIRFNRPIGWLLLLWPTLWALWLASGGTPPTQLIVIFILGSIIMRSAGCIINDIADRDLDGHVERTKQRPLVTGELSVIEALFGFFILALFGFCLVSLLNPLSVKLAVIGVGIIILYPFIKRFSHLPQMVLGVAFSWGIPIAFAAVQNTVPAWGWCLFAVAALWPIAYDTMYAMVDREDDVFIGIKSTAILFGKFDKLLIAGLQLIVLAGLSALGFYLGLIVWYYIGLMVAAVLACYQQWLIKSREPERCFQAFLNNNWFGAVIFLGIVFSV